jgi:hypothetical protein
MPAEFVAPMRAMPIWPSMEGAAHTLAYDGAIVGDSMSGSAPSAERWAAVTVPVLVLDGGTTPWLAAGAATIAATLPLASHRTLAGQTHDVDPGVLAPALVEFFGRG